MYLSYCFGPVDRVATYRLVIRLLNINSGGMGLIVGEKLI